MNIYPIYKRELRSYFQSPGFFVMMGVFLLLSGFFFVNSMTFFSLVSSDAELRKQFGIVSLNLTENVMKDTFAAMIFILLFIVPLFTMRLYAEEKKSNTYELLLSFPFRITDILFGKYFACLTALFIIVLFTVLFPLAVAHYGKIEIPTVIVGYVGVGIIIIAYSAFGIFASSLTENQIIAAVLSFAGLLFFYIINLLNFGRIGNVEAFFNHISFTQHSDNLTKGVIVLNDVYYFLGFALFFLIMTVIVLKLQRRGIKG